MAPSSKRSRDLPASSALPLSPSKVKHPRTTKGQTSSSQLPPTPQEDAILSHDGSDDELDLLIGEDLAAPEADVALGEVDIEVQDKDAQKASSPAPLPSTATRLLKQRKAILDRLSGQVSSHDELVGLDEQVTTLRQTLQATVGKGESNSILLVGAKGSGKSAILNAMLPCLGPRRDYHHVHISARQCTTDRAAMKELARQLVQSGAFDIHDAHTGLNLDEDERDEEDEAEEEEGEVLDDEKEAERREALGNAVLSSLSNTTSSILSLLASASSTSTSTSSAKPLIISLDSFDLLTARPRQALLYCLLDAVQSGTYKPGLAIVGMTRRVDTTDLLEKRVKSRFSHRIVQCYPPADAEEWKEVVGKVLLRTIQPADETTSPFQGDDKAFAEEWQESTMALLQDEHFSSLLRTISDQSKDVHYLFTVLYPPISDLSSFPTSASLLSTDSFILSHAALQNDGIISSLYDVPTLPFLLLIAAKHLQTRDRNVFNFQVAFDEVVRFSRKTRRNREGAGTGGVGLLTTDEGTPLGTPKKGLRKMGVGEGEKISDWEDRQRGMMAFEQLLSLDLLIPDAFLSTLSFGPTTTSASTTSIGLKGNLKRSFPPLITLRETVMEQSHSSVGASLSLCLCTHLGRPTGGGRGVGGDRGGGSQGFLRKEYLRVRSLVEPHLILAIARQRGKRGTLASEVVQWALRGG